MSCCCSDTSGCSEKNPQLWCMPWYFTHPHSQIYILSLFHYSLSLPLSSFYSFRLHVCVFLSLLHAESAEVSTEMQSQLYFCSPTHGEYDLLMQLSKQEENRKKVQYISLVNHSQSRISHSLFPAYGLPHHPHTTYTILPHQNWSFDHQIGPKQMKVSSADVRWRYVCVLQSEDGLWKERGRWSI